MNDKLKGKFFVIVAIVGLINAALQGAISFMESKGKDRGDEKN